MGEREEKYLERKVKVTGSRSPPGNSFYLAYLNSLRDIWEHLRGAWQEHGVTHRVGGTDFEQPHTTPPFPLYITGTELSRSVNIPPAIEVRGFSKASRYRHPGAGILLAF